MSDEVRALLGSWRLTGLHFRMSDTGEVIDVNRAGFLGDLPS